MAAMAEARLSDRRDALLLLAGLLAGLIVGVTWGSIDPQLVWLAFG